MTKVSKHIYRTARALLFAAIIAVAALYLIIYVLVSMPALQKRLVALAEKELSALLASDVEIGRLEIYPFNEVRLSDVKLYEPDREAEGRPCLSVSFVGAGVSLVDLFQGRLVFTYAEVTSLDARITRLSPDTPYNIQFVLDAFRPKEKKESSNLNFRIQTVVIRRLSASYDLLWIPVKEEGFDPAHIKISNFRADISIPSLDTKPFSIDTKVRRIAFTLNERLEVSDLSLSGKFSDRGLELKNFILRLPGSTLAVDDIALKYDSVRGLIHTLTVRSRPVAVRGEVTPSDLSLFLPALGNFREPWNLSLACDFSLRSLSDLRLTMDNPQLGTELKVRGEVDSYTKPEDINGLLTIESLRVAPELTTVLRKFLPQMSPKLTGLLRAVGDPSLDLSGFVERKRGTDRWNGKVEGELVTDAGSLAIDTEGTVGSKLLKLNGSVESDRLDIGALSGLAALSDVGFSTDFDIILAGKDLEGEVTAAIDYLQTSSGLIENVSLVASKSGREVNLNAEAESGPLAMNLEGALELAGSQSQLLASVDLNRLSSDLIGLKGKLSGNTLHGAVTLSTVGNTLDNLTGTVTGQALGFRLPDGTDYSLDRLLLSSEIDENGVRRLTLDSDVIDANVSGRFDYSEVPRRLKILGRDILPTVNPLSDSKTIHIPLRDTECFINGRLTVKPLGTWADFLNLPFRPLVDTGLDFSADFSGGSASLNLTAPYIQQGTSKLIRNTELALTIPAPGRLTLDARTETPTKNSEMLVCLQGDVFGNEATVHAEFNPDREASFSGAFGLKAVVSKLISPAVTLDFESSEFQINGGVWKVQDGRVAYEDKRITARNLKVSHGDQFVKIDGTASASPDDELVVQLADIDLSYIFDALNINYVNFGGHATGKVRASQLFTKTPLARTDSLRARGFSYGGALLGDADLLGVYDAPEQRIDISAHIVSPDVSRRRRADVDGSIWVTRDSLSFNFDADRLNASFMGQFMDAFASDLTATASGKVHLFGTFKNIDLRGRVHADSIRFKLDFTGVRYSGSDSVFLEKGKILIPSFRIYDDEGHRGVFSGELRHTFLRDVYFDFKLRDAKRLLAYDLGKGPDDFWWGKVYASGSASLIGVPGMVDINVDMSSDPESTFFFELSDSEAAAEYSFLTFTDKTPVPDLPKKIETPDFVRQFRKQKKIEEEGPPTDVHIDLRLNATPGVLVTLVMDPASGDKITARGFGPLQLQYETENDEPRLYGKYTITEGLYNFSLQDVILRDFRIQDGSTITFNGDPLAAILNIRAAYRVNTSLTDLDKSFAYDRDLNRTNVPVDAMLLVNGPLDSPDIDFDIELPTLTEETAQKVRSIISTNDLMSRQIIYLLALNKFYTPEYMNTTGSGGEWTSVASSTISSQIGNALSQLTDKLSVMPSIRSDKGDFSDLEMDVALSSRLLNNRLLINGNFGYRDRTTSTTTFVGDFDVQYLLNRRGTFRLKAYNHFNDQNYYLRQALTTQGIGLEFRHDFNRFLSFLRRRNTKQLPDSVSIGEGREKTTEKNTENYGSEESN